MAYLKIYCGYCGQSWDVYGRDMNDEHSRECPHCGSEIDHQTWMGQVLPALGNVMDANRELLKDHLGYHTPVFSFDVLADAKYPNSETTEALDELKDKLAEVSEGMEQITKFMTLLFQLQEGRDDGILED